MMWDLVWCVATNLFCLFPVYISYKKKLDDWLIYLMTAISSILYHLHHLNQYIEPAYTFLNYDAIRMIDLVMSDMSMCWITSCMTYTNIQNKTFFFFLPFDMYIVYLNIYNYRWVFTGLCISTSLIYIFSHIKKYNKKFLCCGLLCSITDLVFYKFLSSIYPLYYNWIHGTHHIFGFLGIYFYIRINELDDCNHHKRFFDI